MYVYSHDVKLGKIIMMRTLISVEITVTGFFPSANTMTEPFELIEETRAAGKFYYIKTISRMLRNKDR